MIVQALRASGIAVEEQVVCQAGAADIVTVRRDAVIEIKLALTRKAIQWAVGQVLLYRQAINPAARAIVVGYATGETAGLMEWAAVVGVEVICWNADDGKLKSELSALSVPSFSLQWHVQALAHSHSIMRVADLARLVGLPRQGLYGVWRGTAVNISVARLERFAQRLGQRPRSGSGRAAGFGGTTGDAWSGPSETRPNRSDWTRRSWRLPHISTPAAGAILDGRGEVRLRRDPGETRGRAGEGRSGV